MCGIAGFISSGERSALDALLRAMCGTIRHRGPDGEGFHLAPADAGGRTVALGHRRLSIVGVSSGGQPLSIDDGRYTIIFNGEIYNYIELRAELEAEGVAFRTASDTEVLLAAYARWGEACLPRLRGMYAFAIWDAAERALFLARDPFGKKPLLYIQNGPELAFASELQALSLHPAFSGEIEPDAVARYLVWKYVPGPITFVRGVRHLPPGCCAVWRDGRFEIRRHYAPPRREPDPAKRLPATEETARLLREELLEAVRLRMRADVPVGAFLSGGIDSSTIVALMAGLSPQPVRTFSIGFEEGEYSELWAARLVADRYATEHHELKMAPDDFMGRFEEATAFRGAPLSEPADLPLYCLSRMAAEHVKVVLSGEGSDELLAGYPKHWGDLYVSRWHAATPAMLDGLALGTAARLLPYRLRRLGILLRVARERDFLARQAAWFGLMNAAEAAALAPGLFEGREPFVWEDDVGPDEGPLHRALRYDKTVWLPNNLLERGDRMTMAASIEGRMPFMDVKLAAFAARLDDGAFLNGRTGKWLLRRAVAADLPDEILTKPKVGFRVPVGDWLIGGMRDYARDLMLGADARLARFCDQGRVRALLDEHQARRRNREKELWALLALEVFLRRMDPPAAARAAA